MARKLRACIASREPAERMAAISLAPGYGRRCALLMCHGFAALAASFALVCRTNAERRSAPFFGRLRELGYLETSTSSRHCLPTSDQQCSLMNNEWVGTSSSSRHCSRLHSLPFARTLGSGAQTHS